MTLTYQLGMNNPLLSASKKGHSEVVSRLLVAKSDVNWQDPLGQSALHMACIGSHRQVVLHLTSAGADFNALTTNPGRPTHCAKTPVDWARGQGWKNPLAPPFASTWGKVGISLSVVGGVTVGAAVFAGLVAASIFTGGLAAPFIIALVTTAAVMIGSLLTTRALEVKCLEKIPTQEEARAELGLSAAAL